MKESLRLKAALRDRTGSIAAAKLRKEGKIPVNLYGHGQEALSLGVNKRDFLDCLHHGGRLLELELDGRDQTVLLKDLQYDAFGKEVLHADLIRVDKSERVIISVPLVFKGTAKGANEGGVVAFHVDDLEIECQVNNIPESVTVNIKDLGLDQHIYAKDIVLPQGIALKTEANVAVVSCSVVVEAAVTEEAEAGAQEPEVIGRKEAAEEAEEK